MAPLTQSTAETPKGPLTLRVYPLAPGLNTPGESCAGEVYADDGHSFDFRKGIFARFHFTCSTGADGSVSVTVGKQEGTWKPWWHEYRIEVVGWTPKSGRGLVDGSSTSLTQVGGRWGVTVPANTRGAQIDLR